MATIYWVTETPNSESDTFDPTVEPVFFSSAYDQQAYIKDEIEDQTYGEDAPTITDMGDDGIREVAFTFHTLLAGKTDIPLAVSGIGRALPYREEVDNCAPGVVERLNRALMEGSA